MSKLKLRFKRLCIRLATKEDSNVEFDQIRDLISNPRIQYFCANCLFESEISKTDDIMCNWGGHFAQKIIESKDLI